MKIENGKYYQFSSGTIIKSVETTDSSTFKGIVIKSRLVLEKEVYVEGTTQYGWQTMNCVEIQYNNNNNNNNKDLFPIY